MSLEDKIEDLEIRLTHQEATIDELNKTVFEQWQTIDRLNKTLELMKDRLKAAAPSDIDDAPYIPPHY